MITMELENIGKSGWLVATCKELPEVIVHGASVSQIMERTPGVVSRALERRYKTDLNQSSVGEGEGSQ